MKFVGRSNSCPVIKDFINVDPAFRIVRPVNPVPSGCSHIIAVCMNRAYSGSSVARRCAGINGASYMTGTFNGQNVKSTMFKEMYRFIQKVLSGSITTQLQFDREHDDLCLNLCGSYSNPQGKTGKITYGIAQKFINMTLKYLYIEHWLGNLRIPGNVYDYFHCPIDSVVMERLSLIYKGSGYFGGLVKHNGSMCYRWRGICRPWSKFDRDHYLNLENEINRVLIGGVTPLELDFLIWTPPSSNVLSRSVVSLLKLPDDNLNNLRGIVVV